MSHSHHYSKGERRFLAIMGLVEAPIAPDSKLADFCPRQIDCLRLSLRVGYDVCGNTPLADITHGLEED